MEEREMSFYSFAKTDLKIKLTKNCHCPRHSPCFGVENHKKTGLTVESSIKMTPIQAHQPQ